jgi:hypothetical protein
MSSDQEVQERKRVSRALSIARKGVDLLLLGVRLVRMLFKLFGR